MRSTDQQTAAPADAEVPAEHEVPDDLRLAAGFPAATREAWRELVAGVLRKAGREDLPQPVEDALRVPVATGVTVGPLYTAEDAGDLPTAVGVPGLAPFVRGSRPAVG
ncbi:MAG: methylmalonyl-CoA mutase, partial [Actinomycetota bacterium]|nr:methylmalonyl-CoA mutase [Actinomycetota bacterium]